MSIFGPCSAMTGTISGTSDTTGQEVDLSEYAKTSHVDVQDSRRVLKAGDTMTGVLDMGGNSVQGLPTSYPPIYEGDEAVSWSQAVSFTSDAVDTRVAKTGDTMSGDLDMGGNAVRGLPTTFPFGVGDEAVSRTQALLLMEGEEQARLAIKPIITVWAEENGSLLNNAYEWSFGNGAAGVPESGYTMLAPGRVLSMGLATTSSDSTSDRAEVNLVVNGTEQLSYRVTKPTGQHSSTTSFRTPLELAQGDRINFRSATTTPNITAAVVSVLIELDL